MELDALALQILLNSLSNLLSQDRRKGDLVDSNDINRSGLLANDGSSEFDTDERSTNDDDLGVGIDACSTQAIVYFG